MMTDIPKNPVVRGARVWLRPMKPEDSVLWSRATQESELAHFTLFPTPEDEGFTRRNFEASLSEHGNKSTFFAICPLNTSDVVGLIGMHSFDWRNGAAEFGIFISDPNARGQGYGSDAINAIMDYGFGEMPLERIMLRVIDYNKRAFALYQRIGFTHEGTLRRAWRHRGQLFDVHIMSILRDEWQRLERPKMWDYTG